MFKSLQAWTVFRWWVICMCISCVLLATDISLTMEPLWNLSNAVVVPIKQQLNPLVSLWRHPLVAFSQQQQLSQEVLALRQEVARELVDQTELARLREENKSLRNLLGAPIHGSWQLYPAQVIGQTGTGWWIDAGSQHQLLKDNPVVVDGVLLGFLDQVQGRQSHIKALDQRAQPMQVVFRDSLTGEKHGVGLLEKDNQGLVVRGILPSDPVIEGDDVMTAGVDQVLPDIVIGRVSSVGTTDETAFYKFARILWVVPDDNPSHVAVIYNW